MQIHPTKLRRVALALAASVLLPASSALAQMELLVDLVVDGGNNYNWQRVALPGTICGNGSQYKFWYYDSPTSNNMVVMFEGGGACWDYDTCSGRAGVLGASNPNGLPDNYIDGMAARYVSPIVNGADPGLPFRSKRNIATNGWDVVYMPYCTGDVHTGNSVATYVDQTGANPPIVWHHAGHYNTIAAANFLHSRFPTVGKLLVTGFSAGGVGTATNYYTMRRTLQPTRGYSLNDSGPLFPAANSSAKSWPLHKKIEVGVGAGDDLLGVPGELQSRQLRIGDDGARYRVPDRLPRVHRVLERLQLLALLVRALLPEHDAVDDPLVLAAGSGQPRQSDEAVHQLQLPHPVASSGERQSLLVDHHVHRQPRLLSIRKKYWYEYILEPWQSWKCASGFKPFEKFFDAGSTTARVAASSRQRITTTTRTPAWRSSTPRVRRALSA